MNVVERLLHECVGPEELHEHGLGEDLSVVLVTPRFVASRHVVALVLDRRGKERLVVKFPRRLGDDAGVQREATILTHLVDHAGDAIGVPRHVVTCVRGGTTFLVETALLGRPLDPREVRRNVARATDAGVAFVESMPRVPASEVTDDWYAVLAAQFDALRGLGHDTVSELVDSTEPLLEPLRQTPLPRVLQHGDLSHPNLLIEDGELRVLDWERAAFSSLPGLDLAFFLTYVGESRRLAFDRAAQVAAFEETFWAEGAWGTSVLRGHLERCGVAAELWPLIILACWATSASTLVERMLGAGGESTRVGGADELVAALQTDRDVLLWRRTVQLLAGSPCGSAGIARTGGVLQMGRVVPKLAQISRARQVTWRGARGEAGAS